MSTPPTLEELATQDEPWQRQAGEEAHWYDRFDQYRLLGPERSVNMVYQHYRSGKGRKTASSVSGAWTNRSVDWSWQYRAEEWDKLQQRARAERYAEAREEDDRQVLKITRQAIKQFHDWLNQNDPLDMEGFFALKLMVEMFKMQRTVHGEASSIRGTMDMTAMRKLTEDMVRKRGVPESEVSDRAERVLRRAEDIAQEVWPDE